MHILVTNDDGPPSNTSSPYVHSLVSTLQSAGHTVSVCLPHIQRSWISKAHIVGQSIKPTYFRPGTLHRDDGTTSTRPLPSNAQDEEWILVDSTPASCVQIGLFHYFKERGPVDLVISGPNYGRNTTAVFALSSGTIGGAMEAAVCGKKAIALSYAFFDRNHDPQVIAGASARAVQIVEHLVGRWGEGVHLYSINIPLVKKVRESRVLWTHMLQNEWQSGSSFEEVEVAEDADQGADEEERKIRKDEEEVEAGGVEEEMGRYDGAGDGKEEGGKPHMRYRHKHFKWAPKFKDVHESVERSGPGNDGWAVKEGLISVTPLRANFMHVDGFEGELKL